MTEHSPFRYFSTGSEIICLAVMMYVRFPLLVRLVAQTLFSISLGIRELTETGSNSSDRTIMEPARQNGFDFNAVEAIRT